MPAANNPKLSAEAVSDPTGFHKKVKAAIKRHKGSVTEAAKDLGVSRRTLCRYIEKSGELQGAVAGARNGGGK